MPEPIEGIRIEAKLWPRIELMQKYHLYLLYDFDINDPSNEPSVIRASAIIEGEPNLLELR